MSRSADVDAAHPGGVSGVARDVAGALAVTDDPKGGGPSLFHAELTRQPQRVRVVILEPRQALIGDASQGGRSPSRSSGARIGYERAAKVSMKAATSIAGIGRAKW